MHTSNPSFDSLSLKAQSFFRHLEDSCGASEPLLSSQSGYVQLNLLSPPFTNAHHFNWSIGTGGQTDHFGHSGPGLFPLTPVSSQPGERYFLGVSHSQLVDTGQKGYIEHSHTTAGIIVFQGTFLIIPLQSTLTAFYH
jgi:hypothetical protein